MGRWVRNSMLSLAAFGAAMSLSGCPPALEDVYSPTEWRSLFGEHGWTALPFPDSKYQPGAIIKVTKESGISYVDHLRSCDYPDELLEPEKGRIPGITFAKSRAFSAAAMLKVNGIGAGPEFSKVAKVQMDVTDHSADALRLIKLRIWQEEAGNLEGNARFCLEELEKPDYYLVTEAFRVAKGKYSLRDKNGVALKLSAANLGRLLELAPDLKYEVSTDGDLTIEENVTFAIRRAVSTSGGFDVLGVPEIRGEKTADQMIDELYREAAK